MIPHDRREKHRNVDGGFTEMKVNVPKIKISKYFKTKYQGAYIPP